MSVYNTAAGLQDNQNMHYKHMPMCVGPACAAHSLSNMNAKAVLFLASHATSGSQSTVSINLFKRCHYQQSVHAHRATELLNGMRWCSSMATGCHNLLHAEGSHRALHAVLLPTRAHWQNVSDT